MLLSEHSQRARYFKSRGKRSTIVTARVTRKAKRHQNIAYLAKNDIFYHLKFYDAKNIDTPLTISQPQPFF